MAQGRRGHAYRPPHLTNRMSRSGLMEPPKSADSGQSIDIPFTPGLPPGHGSAHHVRPSDTLVLERNVRVPMRDGVHLSADIYRPRPDGPHPTLLVASAYPKRLDYLPSNPAY